MSSLYLPGRGMVDLAAARIDAAVSAYDERLVFHPCSPQTSQPTVFMRMEADADTGVQIDGSNVLPVLAFHPNSELTPEDVVRELSRRDTVRHGQTLLSELHRHNDKIKADREYAASEADEIAAEAYEWALRKEGQTFHIKSFRKVR